VYPADRADTRGGGYGARSVSKGSRVQSYARDARLSIRGTESRGRHARIRPRATISLAEREGVPSVEMCLQSRDYYREIATARILTPRRAASSGGHPSIRERRAR